MSTRMNPSASAAPLSEIELAHRIDRFNAEYGRILDSADYESWPGLFTEDCYYRVTARENFDLRRPLSLMALEGRGMLKDRVYGITNTLYHAPYYQRHVIGTAMVRQDMDGLILAEANYAVFRTKPGATSEVFNVGRYLDKFVTGEDGLRLKERVCVYDSEMILNSMIYPI